MILIILFILTFILGIIFILTIESDQGMCADDIFNTIKYIKACDEPTIQYCKIDYRGDITFITIDPQNFKYNVTIKRVCLNDDDDNDVVLTDYEIEAINQKIKECKKKWRCTK